MNILIIGKGGREHALAYVTHKSKKVKQIFVAPGNVGMKHIATCVNIREDDIEELVKFALNQKIDLTIVGPEHVLALGVVNAFQKAGLKIFGPTKEAAQIESSKDFSKQLMESYDIPTATYETFESLESAVAYVLKQGLPIVIKEDGLKAGKGVTVALNLKGALEALILAFDIPKNKVVIEEYLDGFEFSLMAFVHENQVIPMEIAQDHKRAYNDDRGPNTGGMGVYSPVSKVGKELVDEAMNQVMLPAVHALSDMGIPFTGFLYGGLMVTKDGVKTIEFNARFGDPEAEVILPRLQSDFIEVIEQIMNHEEVHLEWNDKKTLGVVLASTGYPSSTTIGSHILGVEDCNLVFHMGTKEVNGNLQTNGGRVLLVVGMGDTLEEAYQKAYEDVAKITSDALFHRTDIGKKDL